jgi:acetolactate synthase-1/2/3 large subunit
VFIEVCLDAQGAPYDGPGDGDSRLAMPALQASTSGVTNVDPDEAAAAIAKLFQTSTRPILLIGGGVRRADVAATLPALRSAGIPVMTTWNGADRVGADEPFYFGRPHTWGQRYANVLLQQADLLVALGTRLGLMQTGFNYQEFVPGGKIAQVDIDPAELVKGHPQIDLPLCADAGAVLSALLAQPLPPVPEWLAFCQRVKGQLPLAESDNLTEPGYLCPYDFVLRLSALCEQGDTVIPCSSGGAFTVTMQAFQQKRGQIMITSKGLASMGYGLAGAIGAALAHPGRRTVLLEGDGGFSQNLQELGTVAVNDLPLKVFLFENDGYASIRMTQRNYFGGQYLGCDSRTGLGLPAWSALFAAYGIPAMDLPLDFEQDSDFQKHFDSPHPAAFIVRVDPAQTYYPKIDSRVAPTGGMESNPLHLMSPPLPDDIAAQVFPDWRTA